jgi:hypothetical protein
MVKTVVNRLSRANGIKAAEVPPDRNPERQIAMKMLVVKHPALKNAFWF